MASSRWKRFAFFDRSTLSIEGDVMLDLIPGLDLGSGRRVSANRNDEVGSLSMAISIAALPLSSQRKETTSTAVQNSPITAMWSTLTACSAPQDPTGSQSTVQLPSQSQILSDYETATSPGRIKDGLVLVFISSQESDMVHCLDVTVRCNPLEAGAPREEDLDGWRGYWTPLPADKPPTDPARSEEKGKTDGESPGQRVMGIATCREGTRLLVAAISKSSVVVDVDPHLHLSCRLPLTSNPAKGFKYKMAAPWNEAHHGHCSCVDVEPGYVVVGTDMGFVLVFSARGSSLRNFMTIPSPSSGTNVTTVKISLTPQKLAVFVTYDKVDTQTSTRGGLGGVCCFDLGTPSASSFPSSPSARYDLDSRHVASHRLCDHIASPSNPALQFMVARADGLYTYSQTQKTAVSPIDGAKFAVCAVPTPLMSKATSTLDAVGSSYSLVASTDSKSGR